LELEQITSSVQEQTDTEARFVNKFSAKQRRPGSLDVRHFQQSRELEADRNELDSADWRQCVHPSDERHRIVASGADAVAWGRSAEFIPRVARFGKHAE